MDYCHSAAHILLLKIISTPQKETKKNNALFIYEYMMQLKDTS